MLFELFSQVFGVKESIFGVKNTILNIFRPPPPLRNVLYALRLMFCRNTMEYPIPLIDLRNLWKPPKKIFSDFK